MPRIDNTKHLRFLNRSTGNKFDKILHSLCRRRVMYLYCNYTRYRKSIPSPCEIEILNARSGDRTELTSPRICNHKSRETNGGGGYLPRLGKAEGEREREAEIKGNI